MTSLRNKWKLKDLLEVVQMAKSSYGYAMRSLQNCDDAQSSLKERIIQVYEASGGTYGYRRILHQIRQDGLCAHGEWTIRRVMKEIDLKGCRAKKRKYNSYAGELSEAPSNTCRNEDGTHVFSADQPNELWVTDLTEFGIPAGKVYLSPIIDCFDGMPVSWSISTSPNAEMANSSLEAACSYLSEGEHPRIHSDRGAHYHWPGWIAICDEHKLVRSMSRKGRTEDNARAEGFFGRLKVEFFHNRDWQHVTVNEFMYFLDGYLRWYREVRLKSDLGYMCPKQYRLSLGLTA